MLLVRQLGDPTIEGLVIFRKPCLRYLTNPRHEGEDRARNVTCG